MSHRLCEDLVFFKKDYLSVTSSGKVHLLASNIETNLLVLLQSIVYIQSNGKSVCAVDTEIKIISSTNNTKVKLSVLIFINYN